MEITFKDSLILQTESYSSCGVLLSLDSSIWRIWADVTGASSVSLISCASKI